MTAQSMAPVIPSSGVLASRQRVRPAAARRLPLASPVPVPSMPEGVVYGIARIDSSGRICERAIINALGWSGGDRLTFTADAGVVTARRDPGGMVNLPASAYFTIPAALRRRCGMEAGDQVLLAALPDQDSLAAYCLAVVDQAIRAHLRRQPARAAGRGGTVGRDQHDGAAPALCIALGLSMDHEVFMLARPEGRARRRRLRARFPLVR